MKIISLIVIVAVLGIFNPVNASGGVSIGDRPHIDIYVDIYTGNGNDNRNIEAQGFSPDFVIIGGLGQGVLGRGSGMTGDESLDLGTGLDYQSNWIQDFINLGFQIGSNARVNQNNNTYHYMAIKGLGDQDYFKTNIYTGTGVDDTNHDIVGWQPDIVWTSGDAANSRTCLTSNSITPNSSRSNTIRSNNAIQSLRPKGFQVGTLVCANVITKEYNYFAWQELAGAVDEGTYTGNATDDRSISIGFQPDFVIVNSNLATVSMYTSEGMATTSGYALATGGGTDQNWIQSFNSDGFVIGDDNRINKNTDSFDYVAFKEGQHATPISEKTIISKTISSKTK